MADRPSLSFLSGTRTWRQKKAVRTGRPSPASDPWVQTWSITWISPLVAAMLAVVMVAPPTAVRCWDPEHQDTEAGLNTLRPETHLHNGRNRKCFPEERGDRGPVAEAGRWMDSWDQVVPGDRRLQV